MVAGIGYYLATPKQQRLPDGYVPEGYELQEDEVVTPTTVARRSEPIAVYYYAKNDTSCSGPLLAFTFDDLDDRVSFQEITSIVALLNKSVPRDYRSAIIPGTTLNQLQIRDGIARVDLSSFLTLNGEKNCGRMARQIQIITTLKQFETVADVAFLVNGTPLE